MHICVFKIGIKKIYQYTIEQKDMYLFTLELKETYQFTMLWNKKQFINPQQNKLIKGYSLVHSEIKKDM